MIKTEKRKIETLFDVSRNPRINLVDMLPGEIPLVTNSKTIPAYTVGNDVPTIPRGTITVSKFGHTNYIDEPFIVSDIMTLTPPRGRREQGARVWFVCVNAIKCCL